MNKCCSIKYLLHLQNAYILHTITPSYKCQVSIVSSLEFKQIKKTLQSASFSYFVSEISGNWKPENHGTFCESMQGCASASPGGDTHPRCSLAQKTRPKSLHRRCVHFPKKNKGNANYRNLTKTIKQIFPTLLVHHFYVHHFFMVFNAGPPNCTEQCRQELQCTSRLVTGNVMDLNGSQCFLRIKDTRKTEKR